MRNVKIFKSAFLFVCLVMPVLAAGQTYDETSWTIPKEITVLDTLKATAMAEEIKQQKRESKNSHLQRLAVLEGMKTVGKRLDTEEKELLLSLLERHKVTEAAAYSKSEYKKILRNANAGVVTEKMLPYIEVAIVEEEAYIKELDKFLFADYLNLARPLPLKTVTIQVANPYNRQRAFDDPQKLDMLDRANQRKWDWIGTGSYEEVTSPAPYYLPLKVYNGHSQYRIYDNYMFDENGNLVGVISCQRDDITSDMKNEIYRKLYVMDYQNNKYDIKSLSADTQYAIRNSLGLSSESAQASEEHMSDLLSAGAEYLFTEDDDLIYDGLNALFEMALEDARMNDEDAKMFLERIKKDHEDDLDYIYRIDRTGDKSFAVMFLDSDKKSTYTLYLKYYTSEPYVVRTTWSIKRSPAWSLSRMAEIEQPAPQRPVNVNLIYRQYPSVTYVPVAGKVVEYIRSLKSEAAKERDSRIVFGYNYSVTAPLGFFGGYTNVNNTKYWGLYGSLRTSVNKIEKEDIYTPTSYSPAGYSRFGITFGGMLQVTKFGYLYAGIGYGHVARTYKYVSGTMDEVQVYWNPEQEKTHKYNSTSRVSGLECEVGLMLHYKWIGLSVGYDFIPTSPGNYFGDVNFGIVFFI